MAGIKAAIMSIAKAIIKLEERRLKDGKHEGYEKPVSDILEKAKKIVDVDGSE